MTGSEMAKAGLLEQNRLSGANRNTLIAGGIMANTAEIFNFPVPDAAQKEPRVADLDDGYTRIANELLEAVMLAGLTQHQLLVFLAVMRKTYGFNKKLDWVSNEQLSGLTGILPHKCSAAKSVLVKRGILIQSGRNIGINNVVSEWSTLPESGKKNKVYLKEVNLPESGKKSLPKSGKGVYPNQVNTKDKLTKDNIKPFSSENSGESSDQPENDLPVVKPDAAIQSGSKWGTAEDLTAAEWMFDMVKTIAPSARKPNFAGWANDIRLMRERDGRNHRDMCVLFRWECQDNFWSGNVLSPAKLRDKWTQLEINRNKQQAGMIASKPKLDLTNTDWIYGVDL
ncbi:replication protein [Escherichia coli]